MFFRGIAAAIFILILDQASKFSILRVFDGRKTPIEVTGFFSLQSVWNPGISFGMFNSIPHGQWVFSALAFVVVLLLFSWMKKATSAFLTYALAFVIGGALGNMIDRLLYGAVVDFLDFHLGKYHWPAFNIADSAIFVGVVMLLLDGMFFSVPEKKEEKSVE